MTLTAVMAELEAAGSEQTRKTYKRHGVPEDRLAAAAIAHARRIGKVEVDHGDTACKTPDAEAYILKTRARKHK